MKRHRKRDFPRKRKRAREVKASKASAEKKPAVAGLWWDRLEVALSIHKLPQRYGRVLWPLNKMAAATLPDAAVKRLERRHESRQRAGDQKAMVEYLGSTIANRNTWVSVPFLSEQVTDGKLHLLTCSRIGVLHRDYMLPGGSRENRYHVIEIPHSVSECGIEIGEILNISESYPNLSSAQRAGKEYHACMVGAPRPYQDRTAMTRYLASIQGMG